MKEVVRARTSGVITNMFITVGQEVKKGQVLGHTYLVDTKYKLDQARLAWENNATLRALEAHADAWSVTREETKAKLRKREVAESRLDWAMHMERFHRSNYEAKLEQQEVNRLHVTYWEKQYEDCFITAPADGVVTTLNKDVGDAVGMAAHVCTIINEESFVVPVPVSAELAKMVSVGSNLPLRTSHDKQLTTGKVESIDRDPNDPKGKVIKVILGPEEVTSSQLPEVAGITFDVLLGRKSEKSGKTRRSL